MTTSAASAVRPGLRDNRTTSSPHTPTRFASINSNFSSPGSTFRQEEDAIIIELGSRYLRAGFEGEGGPQCVIPFDKESSRRVGDYRAHAPGYIKKPSSFEEWARSNELWRNDLKDVDQGLVEDKLDRALREVYNKYLLVDAGKARIILVLPSVVSHPLLERVLTLLFDRWGYSTITLLPSPTMSAVSAGLRSALIVDVGWEETVTTPIYEYRELRAARTSRGMKMLTEEAANALTTFARSTLGPQKAAMLDYDFVESLVMRTAFCEYPKTDHEPEEQLVEQTQALLISGKARTTVAPGEKPIIELGWPVGTTTEQVNIPLSIVSVCVRTIFFDPETKRMPLDDHEQKLPELIYQALLALNPDVRSVCMSRIVFVGGGSRIAGLSARVLQEVQDLINRHGWTPVRGKKVTEQRKKLGVLSQGRAEAPVARHNLDLPTEEKNLAEKLLLKEKAKHAQPEQVIGVLREVESLGAWAGASLMTSLKVKGFVDIERDRFLSHGLSGASREAEISVVPQRMSSFGVTGAKNGDRGTGWTLGGWA